MKGKIFISYRRASDQWALGQLRQKLVEEYGEDNVFFDTHSIEAGDEWLKRLDQEVSQAHVVVVLYCKEWFGPQPDGTRRIDAEDDMVRRELMLAHKHSRVVIPVIIDNSDPPRAAQLPEALHFLLQRQFLPLQPDDLLPNRMHRLVLAIEAAHPGRLFGTRYFKQVTWLALLATVLVAAWHASGGNASYDNAFARNALTLRQTLGLNRQIDPPGQGLGAFAEELPELAVVDIDDAELRTLLGGQPPLDPAVMGTALWALQSASKAADACGPKRPVAINLDLAPNTATQDQDSIDALNRALVALAECRPVILACPASVVRNVGPEEDMKWMQRLLDESPKRLMFTSSTPDPAGLRHAATRSDIGIVAADIASGKPLEELRAQRDLVCACPSTAAQREACGSRAGHAVWDRSAMAVPFSKSSLSLAGALQDMPRVAAKPILLIGGSFGAQPVYAVPGSSADKSATASSTLMQAYLLHGATRHLAVPLRPWMWLGAYAFSWVLAAWVLALGVRLERNNDRFSRRVPAYLGMGVAMLGAPWLALWLAARWPAWTWPAGLLAVLGMITLGRTLLACFEVMLNGGITWRWLGDLWDDIRFDTDKGSAVMKLAGLGLELVLLLACAWVGLQASDWASP